jgi:hypothetical protein
LNQLAQLTLKFSILSALFLRKFGIFKEVKRLKKAVLVFLLTLLLMVTMSMTVVNAMPPTTISGKWSMTGGTFTEKSAGNSNNEFLQGTGTGNFMGSISGPFTSDAYLIIHNSGLSNQWTVMHVVITISPANVMGKTGTLEFMFNGKQGEGGQWVITGGTGDLANLHGQGTWSPTGGFPQIAYVGQIHLDK